MESGGLGLTGWFGGLCISRGFSSIELARYQMESDTPYTSRAQWVESAGSSSE